MLDEATFTMFCNSCFIFLFINKILLLCIYLYRYIQNRV